jgi:hypothetical protein
MRFPSRLTALLAAPAAVLALAGAALAASPPPAPSPATAPSPSSTPPAPPTPKAGVRNWNHWVCGRDYVPVNLGHGDYFNVYNSAGTCISAERNHLSWGVASITPTGGWQFPNISSGWEWSRYTCTDGHSGYPGHGSRCMRYPVQEKHDGYPLSSVTVQNHPGAYNAAYDIWFNKTDAHPKQDNGTELMVWIEHPNIYVPPSAIDWYTTIQGIRYEVAAWITFHNGVHWRYMAYIAVHQRTSLPPTWLNAFFRDAIAHGWLSSNDWLTAIDFGFEISWGGAKLRVYRYSLTGVR